MNDTMGSSILMVVGLFHPVRGGAEKVCQTLAGHFRARGISVTVLTQYRKGLPEHEVIDGIPVYRKMKGWHPLGLAYMLSVFSFLLRHRRRFDIIVCFGLFLFIPPAVLMKYLFRKKAVVRLMCSGDFGDFAAIRPLKAGRLITAAAKRCDSIVCISREIEQELQAKRFSPGRLISIPNGVDVNRYAPSNNASRAAERNICFVGRIEVQKGLEHLLRAIALVREGGGNATLTVVGEGGQRKTLEELARRLKLHDHVLFAGFRQDVLPFYRDALIFVLPSLAEGMSSSLLEAMSCGLPVIVTAVGGNREMVDPGSRVDGIALSGYRIADCGILVNPEDSRGLAGALAKLLDDETLRDRLGERARKHICGRFSQEQIVEGYLALFSRLSSRVLER